MTKTARTVPSHDHADQSSAAELLRVALRRLVVGRDTVCPRRQDGDVGLAGVGVRSEGDIPGVPKGVGRAGHTPVEDGLAVDPGGMLRPDGRLLCDAQVRTVCPPSIITAAPVM